MINLEWFRSFRAVYTTGSVSKAAKHLSLSQPAVSQHIQALESRTGKKLFERKSKGVVPTDSGRSLSNMVAAPIESLETVESAIMDQTSHLTEVISLGISQHLFNSILGDVLHELGAGVHISFADRQSLIKEVERGNILYAIIPGEVNTFDILCHRVLEQNLVLVGTMDIDFNEFQRFLKAGKRTLAEKWLASHNWYAHNTGGDFIKHYWLNIMDKKRPAIVPDYVVPNEYETLRLQSKGNGLSVAFETTVEPFLRSGMLQNCDTTKVKMRDVYLIANERNARPDMTRRLIDLLTA